MGSAKLQNCRRWRPRSTIMKYYICAVAIAASLGFMFAGCADKPAATSTTAASTAEPGKRVHTQEDLRKTGRSETGEALQQVDPSVQTSGR